MYFWYVEFLWGDLVIFKIIWNSPSICQLQAYGFLILMWHFCLYYGSLKHQITNVKAYDILVNVIWLIVIQLLHEFVWISGIFTDWEGLPLSFKRSARIWGTCSSLWAACGKPVQLKPMEEKGPKTINVNSIFVPQKLILY